MEGSGIVFVRRRGQKSIRMRVTGGVVTVSYPYRYPLFLVKRSLSQGDSLAKLYRLEEEKKKILENLFLDQRIYDTHTKKERDIYIDEHKERLAGLVMSYATELGVSYQSIVFKRMKTRFGSCSSNGALTFHYKICFMNERMKKYLIIHELSHLVHMNHGKEFWKLVASFMPEMESAKRELLLLSSYL